MTQGTELGQQVCELGGAENFRGQGVVLRDVLTAVNRWRVGGLGGLGGLVVRSGFFLLKPEATDIYIYRYSYLI